MLFNVNQTEIKIDLKPGIWLFMPDAATGKSRLRKCLRALELQGEPVCGYTYEDTILGRPLKSLLIPGKYRVFMLDRYDMYSGECRDEMRQCARDTIILVDCKQEVNLDYDEFCFLNMTENTIEVSL